MAGLLRKLGIVLWKNLLLKRRHWIFTSLEIVVPTLLFMVLALIKTAAFEEDGVSASKGVNFDVEHDAYE